MTDTSTEEDRPQETRDALHLADVPDVEALRSFPVHELHLGDLLYRVHSLPPVYYGNNITSRFYLPEETGFGTCYLAEHPTPALHEAFWDRGVLTDKEMRELQISSLSIHSEEPLQLADCTHGGASAFGVTLERSAAEYAVTHRWAIRFFEAGFRGIRFWSRHDPHRTAPCIALFARCDSTEMQVLDTDTLEESEAVDTFISIKGIKVRQVPPVP